MAWIYTHLLLPVLGILYVPLDWILGWTAHLSAAWAVTVVGVISGVGVILIQKYGSDQEYLGQCKEDLKVLKARQKAAKKAKDKAAAARLAGLVGRISGNYFWGALKPSLWTVPAITVVALWAGSRLGNLPVRPGETLSITAHFEDRAAGFATLVLPKAVETVGSAISPVVVPKQEAKESAPQGPQAKWQLRITEPGDFPLQIRYSDHTYSVKLPASRSGGRPPEPVIEFAEETPTQDQLQAVAFDLKPSVVCRVIPLLPDPVELPKLPPIPNPDLQWAGLYLWVALLVALPLRTLLKVK
jgi:uncharacterized membrane protein (DUF106 family)